MRLVAGSVSYVESSVFNRADLAKSTVAERIMDEILNAILKDEHTLERRRVQQIVGFCGNGKLSDDSECSSQFRAILRNVRPPILKKYADECLDGTNPRDYNSGLIFQDIVNVVGERLGFDVEHGFYRGSSSRIGHDGLWNSDEFSFVIEVKTSDISVKLEKIAGYRKSLIESNEIDAKKSSVLIVLGRQDTGDLEAQIRGSKYALDIRLIGIDALFVLLEVVGKLRDPSTLYRIVEILKPIEYIRVDKLVGIIFPISQDIPFNDEPEVTEQEETVDIKRPDTTSEANSPTRSPASPVDFPEECIARINKRLGKTLIKNGRVTYTSSDNTTNVVLLNSKRYDDPNRNGYWYGFRPNQDEFLSAKESSYVAFGCGNEDKTVLIPFLRFKEFIPDLWATLSANGELSHKHVIIVESENGLAIRVGNRLVDIDEYSLQ